MKQLKYALLLFVAAPVIVHAQPQVKTTINAATVFLKGAELFSTAKVNLPQGESDVIFTNVAGNVNQQSLTIGADNGIAIQSAVFQNNFLSDTSLSPRARKIKDSIEVLTNLSESLTDKKTVVDEQLDVIRNNKKVAGANTGLSVTELQKLLDLMAVRMNNLLTAQKTLGKDIEKNNQKIQLLNSQFAEETSKNFQPGGQLLVKFYAPTATSANIKMSYVVPNAGWYPSYDLRVEKVSSPVLLHYKANVFQNSGVKWDNIALNLSTGNPNEGAEAPVLSPRYLSFLQAYPAAYSNKRMMNAPQAEMVQYKSLNMAGGRADQGSYIVDGVAVGNSSMNQYTTVNNEGINTTFDIELPYTIPSDGQTHMVNIKKYQVPASYRYVAIPRLDKDAFLQAQVTQWEDLNLLPGETNIFFEGSFVGNGNIDMRNIKDTMNISLGRDKKIIVKREIDKKLHSRKTIGTNERESIAYSIIARNTRKEDIDLVIYDQLPISTDASIIVEDAEYGDALLDETTKSLRWIMSLKPAESKKVQLSYTVKYPKGKTVNNIR